MHWLTWVDSLNLIEVLNIYLALCFVVSTAMRVRIYRSILGLVLASPKRWPKLLQLANTDRTIFLAWPTLLTIALSFLVMLINILAYRLVLIEANVSFKDLRGHGLSLATVLVSGGLMLFLDYRAIFNVGEVDRPALEKDLDRAESWLKSWTAPALRVLTFGFVHPRKIVGAEVHRLLVEANWAMIGGMWRASLRIGAQFGFGLALWLTWALVVRDPI